MEFAYNNAPSVTTSVSSFFVNKGYYPNITVHPERDIASFQAHNFVIDLDKLQSTLKAEISVAQQHYQKSADVWHFSAPDFKVCDKVFVKAKFFQTTQPSKKLSKKYLGPYEIIAQPSTLLFTVICKFHLSGKLHPRGDATSEPYKPAFHGGHLSRNTSHGGAAAFRIFCLPWRRYSYSTQSSMTELLLSVSQHWNFRSGQ